MNCRMKSWLIFRTLFKYATFRAPIGNLPCFSPGQIVPDIRLVSIGAPSFAWALRLQVDRGSIHIALSHDCSRSSLIFLAAHVWELSVAPSQPKRCNGNRSIRSASLTLRFLLASVFQVAESKSLLQKQSCDEGHGKVLFALIKVVW